MTEILLSGVVGSTAYGLAHAQSDIDRLGVFVEPTINLVGFGRPDETHHQTGTEEDLTLHEIGKFLKLALKCNPTILELLYLPEELYESRSPIGERLILNRAGLLSAPAVRDAYLGYATQQMRKLQTRADGTFSSDTRNRSLKHARHLLRLLQCGLDLWATGTMRVRVKDPQKLREDAEFLVRYPDLASEWVETAERAFDSNPTCLPQQPDTALFERILLDTRRLYW